MHPSDPTTDQTVHTPLRGLSFDFPAAFRDVADAVRLWPIWLTLSWVEFNNTYRRSVVGFAWVILSFAAFVFIKLTIFSSLLDTDNPGYYDAFLVLGFFAWYYLSPAVIGAPESFVSAQGWIRSESLPYSLYLLKTIMREFYNFALTSIVTIGALIYLKVPVTAMAWLVVPAVLFYILTAFSLKLLLGIIGARFRDIAHLIRAVMLPLMFLTPIFWMPSQMPGLMKYLWWNPLYHYLEILRAPILDGRFPVESWIFCGVVFAIITTLAFLLFARFKQRIVFWF